MEEELLKIGAAYIRVSTDDQTELSPDSQIKKIHEYAKAHGYIVPDEYIFHDDGISGRTTKKRPGFNKMIATAKTDPKPFDAIFVWKFSRFARSREDSVVFKSMLKRRGIDVISVSEAVGDDKMAILMESLIEAMDEYYSLNLSEEVTRGMIEKISRGEPVVPAPFGYLNAEKTYIPDEENGRADIVKEIFQRYADGESQRAIAISLGKRGVRTKRGNYPENRWVDYILWNPAYIGKIRYTPDGSNAIGKKRDFTNENTMIADGNWQPIISQELWDKVQEMLATQKKMYPKYAKRQQPISHLLKGLVKCSACGSTLSMSSLISGKNGTRTLQCNKYAHGKCQVSHSVTTPKIESAVIQGLKQAVKDKEFTLAPVKRKKDNKSSADFDKLISIEEKKLKRAKDAYLAEIDTIEQYKQNKNEITAKINELKALKDNDTHQEFNVEDFAKKVLGILELVERDDVSITAKNEALHTIIEKIVFEKAKGNLAIYFHDI